MVMKLIMNRVGKISKAEIEFPGLSVIAGINDTGKSTIGKIAFALIKALNFAQRDVLKEKTGVLIEKIVEINGIIIAKQDSDGFFVKFKEKNFWLDLLSKLLQNLSAGLPIKNILENTREKFLRIAPTDRDIKRISDILLQLENEMIIPAREELLNSSIERFIKSEFNGQINNFITSANSEISFIDSPFQLDVAITKDNFNISTIHPDSDISLSLKEATFIESPAFLQVWEVLLNCNVYGNKRENWFQRPITMHLKDLAQKIDSFKLNNSINKYSEMIKNIIGGEFYYDKEQKDILFKKIRNNQETYPLNIINTAIGVRSFGIIDMLLKGSVVNQESLLIVDEPETHLHPEWQLKYAEILVDLVNNGTKVLVTSHSPYMIQALRYYTQKADIYGSKTRFYLAGKSCDDNYSNIVDMGENLDPIFKELSSPMDNIIY